MTKTYTQKQIVELTPLIEEAVKTIVKILIEQPADDIENQNIDLDIDGNTLKVYFPKKIPLLSKMQITPYPSATIFVPGTMPYTIIVDEETISAGKPSHTELNKITGQLVRLIRLTAAKVMLRNIEMDKLIDEKFAKNNFDDIFKRFKGMVEAEYDAYGVSVKLFDTYGQQVKTYLNRDTLTIQDDPARQLKRNQNECLDYTMRFLALGMAFTEHFPDYQFPILTKGRSE